MNRILKFSTWLFILSLSLGFRVFPGKWDISKSDPTIWIKLCSAAVTIDENDITENDPLAGITGLTYNQVIQSVIDDYNNVPSSYLRLALYPADPNNPGTPLAGDSAFSTTLAEKRTIEICFGDTNPAAGVSGGYAQPKYEGGNLVGCNIQAKSEYTKKAKFLTHLLTHELGHCFGLMHPQEGSHSVMSYFQKDLILRLKNDDYAGISYKYPEDEAYSKENYTMGLSGCSPKN